MKHGRMRRVLRDLYTSGGVCTVSVVHLLDAWSALFHLSASN